jgi:hypothetical protein
MKFYYSFLTAFLLVLSAFIFNYKGYLAVKNFVVDGRKDVEQFLNSNLLSESYLFFNKAKVTGSLKERFSDLESVDYSRTLGMSIVVNAKNREPFGYVGENFYIAKDGTYYYSSNQGNDGLVKVVSKDFNSGQKILSEDQVYFIEHFSKKGDVLVNIISENHFTLSYNGVFVEVEKSYDNLVSLADVVDNLIENRSESKNLSLLVLNSRIIVKQ